MSRLQGLPAIAAMFQQARDHNRAAFLPFYTLGYPTYEASLQVFEALAQAGVDGFEIGIPFSDPLADGPTIQEAAQVALENGMTPRKALAGIEALRAQGITQPMLVFSYLNPVLAYGPEAFIKAAKQAGADGFIIPDLPPEEAGPIAALCEAEDMALVQFLAPTSDEGRVSLVTRLASGFIYVLSVTGVTGARAELPPDLQAFIDRLRAQATQPLVLGFGISSAEQARQMDGLVEGFIIGSALIKAAQAGGAEAVRRLAAEVISRQG